MDRENNVHAVLNKVAKTHIVNVNGAYGFGKSTLAIHIGYELVKNGTSVRCINIEDQVAFMISSSKSQRKKLVLMLGLSSVTTIMLMNHINTLSQNLVDHHYLHQEANN